ncbi:glycoside hydrolase family 32 protein [Neolewinella lacunae]|uniref:Glycoside hydrolase family 32 protein n=1 Tax=Neolewinella lacunae TaxID=1517758 RepID=A0A923PN93_9BACT|nr:glycoside hydrolase family 32 protein [Neolewinella lacunae]MBC6993637.1 glycoside hydrolase family 32 protein [Neolewinella lacunae]MDN3634735.1 glycoside hydrolase family 32 protein [Neolewinella lacunae]
MFKSALFFAAVVFLLGCGGAPGGESTSTADQASTAPAAAPANEKSAAPDAHYRPAYHFTPPAGWMNDPNGMVYFEGEYHLFYQHFPDGNTWGPMHWGHAVSSDLVTWEHLPIALAPDEKGYIFSGSAVVDRGNTSGFGQGGRPPLVAMFTYHDMAAEKAGKQDFQSQAIAYSNDRGRTWTKYAGNPVIPNQGVRDFRDPKVFWDAAHRQWTMVLAAQDRVQFFSSPDLKNWTYRSDFGASAPNHAGVWECPELFPLKISESGETAWVLLVSINPGGANGGSGTFYFVGDWDGSTFRPRKEAIPTPQDTVQWVDYGRDNYAGVTFSDVPATDGRRIFMGWMSNWDYANEVPTTTWRSAMTLPRELTLHDTDFGTRLHQQPARELLKLRGQRIPLEMPRIGDGTTTIDLSQLPAAGVFELDLTIDLVDSDAEELYLTLSDATGEQFYRVGYSRRSGVDNAFFTDRRQAGQTDFRPSFAPGLTVAPRWSNEGNLRIHAFFDRTSAEVFFDGGDPVLTDIFFPTEPFTQLTLESYGSAGEGMQEGWSLVEGSIWALE